MSTGDLVSRVYSGFRGVDFRGEEINLVRSPDSLNVWKDYRKTESIRTRPGLKPFLPLTETKALNGIYFAEGVFLVHIDTQLWSIYVDEETGLAEYDQLIVPDMANTKSCGFFSGDHLYIKDGKYYLKVTHSDVCEEVEGYVPTTSIARKPSSDGKPSGGTPHEDINMLTGRRINTFLADSVGNYYFLDAKNIDTSFAPIVKVNDAVVTSGYKVDYTKGLITFTKAPDPNGTDGQDNVSIEFQKTIEGYRDRIMECTMLQVFDNRVFFSGNPYYPNMVWHSALNDPSYVSDMDFYQEGLDNAKVTGMVAGNNALWVFREPSDANTTIYYHTPTMDDEYGKIYPSVHSSISTGCVGKAINFNDDIVFFSERGMEGISGDVTTEQVVAHRSSLVDRKLLAEENYKNMVLAEWEGYLLVFIGNKVYLADSRAMLTNENHYEYEWFYWELEKEITCAKVRDGVLYLGTKDGIYTLTDNEANMESYWVTPKDKFQYPHKLKTTNKRGCVAEANGDIAVYAKLEDTDFELIGEYNGVTDYFVSRIKRKKWKDIQLKFHSNTRFSLETVTLEAFVGGYIKR